VDEAESVREWDAAAERDALGVMLLEGLSLELSVAVGELDGQLVAAPLLVMLAVPHGDALVEELPQGEGEKLAVKLLVADTEEVRVTLVELLMLP
jgi:hypothetical protein